MSAVRNFSENAMKVVKTSYQDLENSRPGNDFHWFGRQFCEVIENAEGVPFQLIFGENAGDGYYLNIGEGIRSLLGVDPSAFNERIYLDMIEQVIPLSGEVSTNIAESRMKFISGEISGYRAEVLVRTKSGEKKWIRDSSIPMRDETTGIVIGSLGILFDITDRKLASARADESDRLKAAFLNNISHEVRTPLNAIVGFSALLCEPGESSYRKKEFIDIINNSTDHFLETMDNILEISRIEAGAVTIIKREVDIRHLMNRISLRYHQAAVEKNLHLLCTITDESENIINTDGYKLSQVMNNLIGNAIKFTMEGRIEFGYRIKGNSAEFFVEDTGIGIGELYKPHVFEKFFQAESGITRRFPGTGLGLAISKKYIEMLGGSINFASEAGRGSIFWFTLPLR